MSDEEHEPETYKPFKSTGAICARIMRSVVALEETGGTVSFQHINALGAPMRGDRSPHHEKDLQAEA